MRRLEAIDRNKLACESAGVLEEKSYIDLLCHASYDPGLCQPIVILAGEAVKRSEILMA